MSSRLLTMKFMQRAAASSPTTPTTPASETSQPPSSKRQKLSNAAPSTPLTPFTDQTAVQAALDAEEAKRSEALERVASEKGETKWVLSFVEDGKEGEGLKVSRAGYGDIDGGGMREQGRMGFGKFSGKAEKPSSGAAHDSFSLSSDEASDVVDGTDSEDANGAGDLIRQTREEVVDRAKAERKAKKKVEKAEAAKMAERRRSKEVNVNKLSSISGGGNWRGKMPTMECHGCGEQGHIKPNCPNRGRKRKSGHGGHRSGKKSRKEDVLNY